ncbi:TetR/AcrR family transcriptional regulator [Rhodococcus sp. NPDC003348]
MERVLAAVEDLLADKPFEQITIAEISARSSSSPTSIYARFTDKNGLLLAAHERFKHEAEQRLVDRLGSEDTAALTPAEIFDLYARALVETFGEHHNLLRSVVLADSDVMYARAAELMATTSRLLANRLRPEITVDQDTGERCIDFAVRTVTAVLQQHVIFENRTPGRFALSDDEMAARLVEILTATTAPIFG